MLKAHNSHLLKTTRSAVLSRGIQAYPARSSVQMLDAQMNTTFLELEAFSAPEWAKCLAPAPTHRYRLAMLPTPIHRWNLPDLPSDVEVWIKRDDLSGMQMSGNKVRKLEFLMAAAKQGYDCVITIGGIQSNHCRATATAARYLGMDCHLILRMGRLEVNNDPGLVGNLLVDRLAGAVLHKVTKEEYITKGSVALCKQLEAQLIASGHKPYIIPVGGSNALGTWGYIEAIDEIQQQQALISQRQNPDLKAAGFFSDIVLACGSGGTTAGLALGCHLSGLGARVHGYCVCDDPNYFYTFIDEIVAGFQAKDTEAQTEALSTTKLPPAREILRLVQAKGHGYAISSKEELQTTKDVAQVTGVILDPVYSGKALHAMLSEIRSSPEDWAGRRILFVHTGGLLGMYDKAHQLQDLLSTSDDHSIERLHVNNT